jgi:hypothetical protein
MVRETPFAHIIVLVMSAVVFAGPYGEKGVSGYIGSDWRHAEPGDADAVVNPIFRGWADGVVSYEPTSQYIELWWKDPNKALGPATGDNLYDIVSLGDLEEGQIISGERPGEITLSFSETIRDGNGYDFAVFENGIISEWNTGAGSVAGQMFAELGYVEVSSDGVNFARLPGVSLTGGRVGMYGTIEISDVYNLVGKHPNGNGVCTGTPFDLREIAGDPNVAAGLVDINNIGYVRIVDIPGSGNYFDEAIRHIDANTRPDWEHYANNHAVYDAWVTFGSGGVDLEAVGVLEEQQYSADINLDGIVDGHDFALFGWAWGGHFGQANWIGRCDLAEPRDYVVDIFDLEVFVSQWLEVEEWRRQ